MDRSKQLRMTGFIAFFLSGVSAISSGVIVSILQEMHGFSFAVTGTLLSLMSIGNMSASFLTGLLPAKIGTRMTVMILCLGYSLGYGLMAVTGVTALLMLAFLMVGMAKGCAINTCTVLVGNNTDDRARAMSIMHAFYATGALICPFIIAAMRGVGQTLPMIAVALCGMAMWAVFMSAKLPGRTQEAAQKEKTDFSFLKNAKFWLLTALVFCQNAAETSVTGWMVTYYKSQEILSGGLSTYTVTIMWGATLIARLLIAFVFPIKDTFRALAVMGLGCTALYGAMMFMNTPAAAIVMLFAFAFSMAGVNPIAVAGTGKQMSAASMGILLPTASIGAIVMPWIIGQVADSVSLQAGMACNLVPCAGIMILSLIVKKMETKKA
ncbi:MAG: MFS transporter [Clostridia bacterium]|nr:MFS transporter [Clostridia bacterium]